MPHLLAAAAVLSLAVADASTKPIVEIKGAKPNAAAFKASKATKPLVIKTMADAKKYFDKKNLKNLKGVDFTKQYLVVFAWRGSGKDKISYDVAESFPEQIHFKYQRGRTRDLRSHTRVFALRKNVKHMVR